MRGTARVADAFAGAKFGSLTVQSVDEPSRARRAVVRCDCGVEKSIRITDLARTKSCGCANRLPVVAPGQRFGKLIVSSVAGLVATCRCECGSDHATRTYLLVGGKTRSCGCLTLKHGHGRSGLRSGTYSSWMSMISRCSNPRAPGFEMWGGRGITVCDRWLSFDAFLADMGERPGGHSIDRIDNDGNYEPGNCRWATAKEQSRNQRTTKLSESDVRDLVSGSLASLSNADAARALGVSYGHVWNIRRGNAWSDITLAALGAKET